MPTASFRFNRGMAPADVCPRYASTAKTVAHYFFLCLKPRLIWLRNNDVFSPGNSWSLEKIAALNRHSASECAFLSSSRNPSFFLHFGTLLGFVFVVALEVFGLNPVLRVSFWRYGMDCVHVYNHQNLVWKIKDIIQRHWSVRILLIQRSANSVANSLAKNAATSQLAYSEWSTPSVDLLGLLQQDLVT
ncbi:hypothetical protein PIB30_039189 [Stylosanthes scabra]|uniref:RNase H type-1 domain-containing protein n=1 Tax=Stylosanthes scabra TaxID=79078 RepID=A0ABU6YG66_9FABA|nr:hypothetical protein [Stylosanthes scabra]